MDTLATKMYHGKGRDGNMSIWDKLKQAVNKKEEPKAKRGKKLSPKEQATKNGEPWVEVLSMEIDPNDPGNGAFELDWNDIFLARLVKAGYQGKTDADIVDNWFKAVCRNVIMENYEQDMADPEARQRQTVNKKDLGDGRSEIS